MDGRARPGNINPAWTVGDEPTRQQGAWPGQRSEAYQSVRESKPQSRTRMPSSSLTVRHRQTNETNDRYTSSQFKSSKPPCCNSASITHLRWACFAAPWLHLLPIRHVRFQSDSLYQRKQMFSRNQNDWFSEPLLSSPSFLPSHGTKWNPMSVVKRFSSSHIPSREAHQSSWHIMRDQMVTKKTDSRPAAAA